MLGERYRVDRSVGHFSGLCKSTIVRSFSNGDRMAEVSDSLPCMLIVGISQDEFESLRVSVIERRLSDSGDGIVKGIWLEAPNIGEIVGTVV